MAESQRQPGASSELIYRIVVFVVAGVMVLGMVRLRFCGELGLPAKPPMPEVKPVSVREVTAKVEGDPMAYAGYLEQDSAAFQVTPAATPEQMAAVLAHRVDETGYELDPAGDRRVIEAVGLSITISVRDIEDSPEKMMVLGIANLTDRPLAYRVVTEPDAGTKVCHRKEQLGHNALALPPGGRIERSECLYRKGWRLAVRRVETIELSALSYFYVSKLPPEAVGIDSRVSRGHLPPMGSACNLMLPATVRGALDRGKLTWRDLVDFYARHRCDTYQFPEDYRAFSRSDERALPVMPPR